MYKKLIVIPFIGFIFSTMAQISEVEILLEMPQQLNESSGAIYFNESIVSHNDGNNSNSLYELDPSSGLITRTVTVSNATNTDWEDITQDDAFIYVGDIGNNNGVRTDLKIYKINKSDYLASVNVTADIINFNYADQVDFDFGQNNTIWDAESLISFDAATLILFTKNWIDGTTKAYAIPKESGTYSIEPLPTILDSGGLISGATYNPSTGKVYFIGYNSILQPFIWVSENFTDNDIFSGTNTQTPLSSLGFEQTESITYWNDNSYFITSESFNIPPISDTAKLISFSTNDIVLSINEDTINTLSIYPNPVYDVLFVDAEGFNSIEIYDTKLVLVQHSPYQNVNVAKLNAGIYFLKILFNDHSYDIKKIIKN